MACDHVLRLPPDQRFTWILHHGLLDLADCERLPDELRAQTAEEAARNLAVNRLRIWRFQEAVDALDGIPVCPLKGIALLDSVYRDDPGRRAMTDVDILVPDRYLPEAVRRLDRAMGLRESPDSARAHRVHHHRLVSDGAFRLELHRRLGLKHGRATAWSDLAPHPSRMHDRDVYQLDRECQLVHLVSHLVNHGPFTCLKWVIDILLWEARGFDGERAQSRAESFGAAATLVAGVRLLRQTLGCDVLAGLSAGISGWRRVAVAANHRWVWRSARSQGLGCRAGDSRLRRHLSALLLADSPDDAGRWVLAKTMELGLRVGARTGAVRRR